MTVSTAPAKSAHREITAPQQHVELDIVGMHCASCTARVENALLAVTGVHDARVNLANERAYCTIAPTLTQAQLAQVIEEAGFAVASPDELLGHERSAAADETRQTLRAAIIAGLLTAPVFFLEMGGHLYPPLQAWLAIYLSDSLNHLLQAVLITVVLAWPGRVFFSAGIAALARLTPDMNSLVALGTGAAWLYSICVLAFTGWFPEGTSHVYFESAGVVVTLVLLGRFFESKAKYQAGSAVRAMLNLQPDSALMWDGEAYVATTISTIPVGAKILVKPGETIAVDGKVVEGSSFVNEAMFSGEPIPVAKHVDDSVTGGTLNTNGALVVVATRTGADTALAKIIAAVEYAQAAKLPIQGFTDRVVQWFVPTVLVIALLTFVVWITLAGTQALDLALLSAVAVLIVACPCALGLATPTSILVGTGIAAKRGIIFRHGDALQILSEVDVVAFDKTGTLTVGQPELTELSVAGEWDSTLVLGMAASVEQSSEHPLAQSIVEAAQQRGLTLSPVEKFESQPGFGVSGFVSGQRVVVGSRRMLVQAQIDTDLLDKESLDFAGQGHSVLWVAIDDRLAGVIAVSDTIKVSAGALLRDLASHKLQTVVLSGDNLAAVQNVATELNITDVFAELLPTDKVDVLTGLQQQGKRVAFVGDGINDAPALAQADVGIALGCGTDVAIESADVVVSGDALDGVSEAFALSRGVMTNIKQNLFWAFIYNLLLIPVAAGLLYPFLGLQLSPALAAVAMALSSLFVVSNALRLNYINLFQSERIERTAVEG